jgi:hypothetical protein
MQRGSISPILSSPIKNSIQKHPLGSSFPFIKIGNIAPILIAAVHALFGFLIEFVEGIDTPYNAIQVQALNEFLAEFGG